MVAKVLTKADLKAAATAIKAKIDSAREGTATVYGQFTKLVQSNGSGENYADLVSDAVVREFLGERVVHMLEESGYFVPNKTFEMTVGIKRETLEDDKLGLYNDEINNIGTRASEFRDRQAFGILSKGESMKGPDGAALFGSHKVGGKNVSNILGGESNGVILLSTRAKPVLEQERLAFEFTSNTEGDDAFNLDLFKFGLRGRFGYAPWLWQGATMIKAGLTQTSFDDAYDAIMSRESEVGESLGLVPDLLIVGPSNRKAAMEIAKAERLSDGGSNVNQGIVQVIVTPFLK